MVAEIRAFKFRPRNRPKVTLNPAGVLHPVAIRISVRKKKSSLRANLNPDLMAAKARLSKFLGQARFGRFLTERQRHLFRVGINDATTQQRLTEIHGEIVLAYFIRKLDGEALYEWGAGTGIDGLSIPTKDFRDRLLAEIQRTNAPDSNKTFLGAAENSRALFVFEAKGPGAKLGGSGSGGEQMSAYWVAHNLRANDDAWAAVERIQQNTAVPQNERLSREISIGKSHSRCTWVRANTLPILIEARPLREGGRMSILLGDCIVLHYRDIDDRELGRPGPIPIATFAFN